MHFRLAYLVGDGLDLKVNNLCNNNIGFQVILEYILFSLQIKLSKNVISYKA